MKYAVATAVFVVFYALIALAQGPPTDPTQVTINAQAAFFDSRGYCDTTVPNANMNVFARGLIMAPSRLNAQFYSAVRYVKITNNSPNAGEFFGVMMGGPGGEIFDRVKSQSDSLQIQVRRPTNCGLSCGNPANPFPVGPADLKIFDNGIFQAYCVVFYS